MREGRTQGRIGNISGRWHPLIFSKYGLSGMIILHMNHVLLDKLNTQENDKKLHCGKAKASLEVSLQKMWPYLILLMKIDLWMRTNSLIASSEHSWLWQQYISTWHTVVWLVHTCLSCVYLRECVRLRWDYLCVRQSSRVHKLISINNNRVHSKFVKLK